MSLNGILKNVDKKVWQLDLALVSPFQLVQMHYNIV